MIPSKKTPIIIYGFEPWGDTPFNASGALIKEGILQAELKHRNFDLDAYKFVVLPVLRDALTDWVAAEGVKPFGFIGLGSSASAEHVTVESWFRNEYEGFPVIPGVAVGGMVPCNILPEQGDSFSFGDAQSAGTFVCNASALHGFYLASGQSAFIHIPKQEDSKQLPVLARGVANAISQMNFSHFNFFPTKIGPELALIHES